jgi:hypothetical protein
LFSIKLLMAVLVNAVIHPISGCCLIPSICGCVVRPPKPALSAFVSPTVLQLPAAPGTQWIHAANMKNQTIAISMNLPQGNGETYYVPLNGGDSTLNDNGGDWHSGSPLPCGIQSGNYAFISARNALDSNPDAVALWGDITSGSMTETVAACQGGHHDGDGHHGDGR